MVIAKKLTPEEMEERIKSTMSPEEYEEYKKRKAMYGTLITKKVETNKKERKVSESTNESDNNVVNKEEKKKEKKEKKTKTKKGELRTLIGEKMIEVAKTEGVNDINEIYKCMTKIRKKMRDGKYGEFTRRKKSK